MAAGQAIDDLSSEVTRLRTVIAMERAQVIYYIAVATGEHKVISNRMPYFLEQPEPVQVAYLSKAAAELIAQKVLPEEGGISAGEPEAQSLLVQ